MKTFTPKTERSVNGGSQKLYQFDNGFGASVVQGPHTYGGNDGKWELAVIKWDGDKFKLNYDTPVTSDVIGHLSENEVAVHLERIEAL